MKLRSYPEYKASGVPWLGKIPMHWEVRRNGQLFAQRNQTGFADLPILEVSLKTGVRVRDFENSKRKQVMADRDKYKRAARGDIAYNMMRMWQGAVGVAPVDGLVSPAYVVASPFQEVEARYFIYLFRTNVYMHEVDNYSRGIVKDRNRLYWDEFKQIPSAFPPTNEQKTIADFLDGNARMIRRLVSAKGRLMELLHEQKQAIIHRAVTRGLNLNVRLKSSGIAWFGDVPEHWEVKKLKYLCNTIFGGATPPSGQPECWDGEIVWVTPQDIGQGDRLRDSARRITSIGLASCSTVLVPAGSIIITSRAPVGNVAVAEVELCTNQGCKALLLHPECLRSDFAFLLLQTFKDELQSLATGTTFTEISTSRLANVKVALPPLPEQEDIVRRVAVSTEALNDTIDRARREIDLLREYRTRLIADVVTGKQDVRGVELPALDEAEALAEWEIDEDTETDEMDEREDVDA